MDPVTWSVDQVVAYLCDRKSLLHVKIQIKPTLNLDTLRIALQENDIDGESLLALEDVNVKDDLGIASFGQRREVRKIVLHLRDSSPSYTSVETSKRRHDSEPDAASDKSPEPKKRRRIQPENISSEPLSVTRPEEFDPNDLEEEWQEFLRRHQEDSEDEILRPYNESDVEKELDSDDSLLNELDDDEPPTPPAKEARLQTEDIAEAIDEAIQDFKTAWNHHKRPQKYRIAHRRWTQAAKAQTRKPQQIALLRELELYKARLAKFRSSILDISIEYHKIEEVKQNCLNLQATVEDITEREYYLEVLESNQPPVAQSPRGEIAGSQEILSEGEEILQSSTNETETETEIDSDDNVSFVSDDQSGLSLPYDPADNDWHPQLLEPVPKELLIEQQPSTDRTTPDQTPAIEPVPDLHLDQPPVLFGIGANATLDSRSSTSSHSTMDLPLATDTFAEPEVFEVAHGDEEDSELDRSRLPRSRYLPERDTTTKYLPGGETTDNAILIDSSPAASAHNHDMFSDHSIRTPPLNPLLDTPTKIVKLEQHRPAQRRFPDIQATRALKWADIGRNPFMALCKVVYRHSRTNASDVLEHVGEFTINELPEALRSGIGDIQDTEDHDTDKKEAEPAIIWTFFFIVYACRKGFRDVWDVSEENLNETYEKTDAQAAEFDRILRPLLSHYIDTDTTPASKIFQQQSPQKVPPPRLNLRQSSSLPGDVSPPSGSRLPQPKWTDSDTDIEELSSAKKRKRPIQQSQEALALQRDDQSRVQAQEERRQMIIERFRTHAASGKDRHVAVNTEEPIIYLDQHIARRVKDHQITGIQFVWRELIEDQKHQGCLLAHTMGLGKTMQVVSFLVTLAQANKSADPQIKALIPTSLRSKKVLVMCPASLVDNWFDEILMWTPSQDPGLLGAVYKVFGSRDAKMQIVRNWNAHPGILLISYESLRSLVKKKRNVSDEERAYLEKSLIKDPCIVIGDEAHKMKNSKSSINNLAKQFRSTSRIALTGSPLNNHLEEYHTMIDWIAPGYLGSILQFKSKYSEPIERGLWQDSSRYEKRKSLEKLYVLKRDLAPKIDRKDISAIAADMPQKIEFFITVPLTAAQNEIYTMLVKHILAGLASTTGLAPKSSNAQLWSWLSILSWLCNHPACLVRKLEEKEDTYQSAIEQLEAEEDSVLPADVDLRGSPITTLLPHFLECLRAHESTEGISDPALSTRAVISQRLIQESIAQGEKTLLFSHSIPTLNYLQTMLEGMGCGYLRIDGSTRTDQRQLATKVFNESNNDYMVFLISTRAGGLGLNLQGATRVIIYDFGFNPTWEEQAIGRAYRLGQKKPVFVYRFRAGGTFEEAIYNKSIFKTQLFSRVVDQKNVIRHASKKLEDYLFTPKTVEQRGLSEFDGKDPLLDRIIQLEPDAIKELILTETFQREDEDDELTEQERALAEEQVEMERLARIDPIEFNKRQHEIRVREARQRNAIPSVLPDGQLYGRPPFDQVWGPNRLLLASDENPFRLLHGSEEAPEASTSTVVEGAATVMESTPTVVESVKPPGCQQQ